MGIEINPLNHADSIAKHLQRTPGGYPRIQLSERTGCRISRVGKRSFLLFKPLPVQGSESRKSDEYLAPDLHPSRNRKRWVAQEHKRDSPNRPHVGGNILTRKTISPGGSSGKQAFFIYQFHCCPIHLWFRSVGNRCIRPQQLLDPVIKGLDLVFVKSVL